jgi:hypothetical protein
MGWLLGGELSGEGALVWGAPAALVGVAAALALVAWVAAAAFGPRGQARLRAAELVAWAICLAALVVGVGDPAWLAASGRTEPGRLVVLVDASASMGVREGGAPRSERASALLSRLSAGEDVDVFNFDEELRSGPPAGWTGRSTDLGMALSTVADRYLGQKLRGVVVITDGIDRGGLRAGWRAASEAGSVGGALAVPLPGPLTLYQVGTGSAQGDVAVDEVITSGFAFQRSPFTLRARLRGLPGQTLPVQLSCDGRSINSRDVTLDEAGVGTVSFEVTEREVGRFVWEVSVPVADDDPVPGNNSYQSVVRVVRDHLRVLQVSGSPSLDTKFLRLFLKEDPSVDLVSFFILRTPEDMGAGWGTDELSLIQFPYEKLFTEELDSFDLVIFQNFNYGPYFEGGGEELLANVAEYVRAGHALVMTGGDRSFDLADYANTPLAEVLPVRLGVTGVAVDERTFRPSLTQMGAGHSILRLAATVEESQALWQQLPELDGINLTNGLASDSAALLVHPELKTTAGEPMPVVAVREVGRGRTMALTVDASWRWSLSEAAEGRGNQAYLRFWKGAMRWLVADPDDRPLVVTPSRENVVLGEELRLVVRARDAGSAPVAATVIEGTISGPGGRKEPMTLTTDSNGEAVLDFKPAVRGAWRVKVRGRLGSALEEAETVFAVSDRDPELAEIVPDQAFLQGLAGLYGASGAWRGPGDDSAPLEDPAAVRVVNEQTRVAFGRSPLLGGIVGLTAAAAWLFRRRAGAR